MQVEALENRNVPSAYLQTDPVGDFLPGYTGPHDPGFDVVSHEAVLVGDHVVFAGEILKAKQALTGPAPPRRSVCALGTMRFHPIADYKEIPS